MVKKKAQFISIAKSKNCEKEFIFKKVKRKSKPVSNSIAGYCQEIFDLHFLHFPRRKRKLNKGTNSYQRSVFPQEKHLERSNPIDMPVP
jgi:hypothetical protein